MTYSPVNNQPTPLPPVSINTLPLALGVLSIRNESADAPAGGGGGPVGYPIDSG